MTDGDGRSPIRPAPAVRDVPAELRGREVSGRGFAVQWQAARARGIDAAELAAGTGYSVEQLTNQKERVSWAAFATFMTNLGAHLTDDELIALGDAAMGSPSLRLLLLPGRLLFSVPELYLWAWGPKGPASQVIANYAGQIEETADGRLRFETHMLPGYAPSRENYLLLEGSLRGLSRTAGAGPSAVVHTPLPDGALYLVTVPRTGGALRFIRRGVNWLFAARSTADALRQANEELNDRYVELQAEMAARAETSDRLAGIVEASVDGIVGTTLDGVVTDWNPAAERIYGFTADEARGRRVNEIIPPDRLAETEILLERLRSGERIVRFDTERLHKDGTPVQVSLGMAPVRDQAGTIVGFSTLVRDVTEAVHAERARVELETQLLHAQRLESIGRLAGGVAHDFNNILTAILGFSRLTADSLPPHDPSRPNLEAIETAATGAAKLVRQLLAFGRQQVLHPEILDLAELIERVGPMLRRLIGEDVRTTFRADSDLWSVEGDPAQVEQILVNLVVNARDAMPGGGQLTVELANAVLDEQYASDHVGVTPGRYVRLTVSDSGIGMDAETQAQIFEPFYTTKDASKGTGLGLSTVYGIVKQSGGNIWVYSEPGHGTTFRVYLPQAIGAAPAPPSPAQGVQLAGGHDESVLVVEDEELLRPLLDTMLRRLGYQVRIASDAASAIDIVRTTPIDVVVTDVVMPGGTGLDLARLIHAEAPDLPVLFMSGYSAAAIQDRGQITDVSELIEKPFTAETLGRAIRGALDRRP